MSMLGKEILVTADNKVGTLLKVTAPLKDAGVAIRAACGWSEGEKANFLFILDNNDKGLQALKKAGFTARENEVVLAELPNETGALAGAAQRLSGGGVDIDHCYVSALGPKALAVFATRDNAKAVRVL